MCTHAEDRQHQLMQTMDINQARPQRLQALVVFLSPETSSAMYMPGCRPNLRGQKFNFGQELLKSPVNTSKVWEMKC